MHHAIIGCGQVAPNHVDGFRAVPGVTVGWACDRDGARARDLARQYGIPRVTTDHRDLLANADVRSVSIAVDHAQHAGLASEALAAGKHVLLEKPIALDVEDGRRLCRLADDHGLVLAVVAQHRYDPIVQAVGDWLADGLIGRVVLASAQVECSRDRGYYENSYWRGTWWGEGGSVLINQAYHCVDILTALCGPFANVTSMMAALRTGDVIDTEDTFAAVLEGASGALVTVSATVAGHAYWDARMSLIGTDGSVSLALNHPVRLTHWKGSPQLVARAEELVEATRPVPAAKEDVYNISHRSQIADFCRAVEEGRPLAVAPADAVATLGTINALYGAVRPGAGSVGVAGRRGPQAAGAVS